MFCVLVWFYGFGCLVLLFVSYDVFVFVGGFVRVWMGCVLCVLVYEFGCVVCGFWVVLILIVT